jgi:hypothetical protein
MKKQLLSFGLGLACLCATGQSPVPNGNFENWISTNIENPKNYPNTSNAEEFFHYGLPFNVTRSTDAYHGTYAVQLTTNASATDTVFGYFINVSPDGSPDTWTGGMPYDEMPTGIRAWYKYNVATTDSGVIILSFSKGGVNIGYYFIKLGGIKTDYTLLDYTLQPPLTETPDAVIIGVTSANFKAGEDSPHGPAGSTLLIDSISFTGVNSQPSEMNGDFEDWDSQAVNFPEHWYIQTERGAGFARSDDASEGSYALELTTYETSQNNNAVARPANASTGYYPQDCNGNCNILGGNPFVNQQDTLMFDYKYEPAAVGDTAWMNIYFKKNGSIFWSGGLFLQETPTYVQMQVPLAADEAPDSVIIEIQSGLWYDTTLNYVGSKLLVDNIRFRSEEQVPTGIPDNRKEGWHVYPNPTSGMIYIKGMADDVSSLEITDMSGKKVLSYTGGPKPVPGGIDLSTFGKGTYFITIKEGKGTRTEKIVVK